MKMDDRYVTCPNCGYIWFTMDVGFTMDPNWRPRSEYEVSPFYQVRILYRCLECGKTWNIIEIYNRNYMRKKFLEE
ncbi:MAG: hypothetical protein ACTSQ8_18815 [Candidatus Helarchaeota archaeon]